MNEQADILDSTSESIRQLKYEPSPDHIDQNNTTGVDEDAVHESELMRSVTNYTEYSVQQGTALIDEEKRQLGFTMPPKYKFFSKHNKEMRITVSKQYVGIILALFSFILGVWSIYWGSMWNRQDRLVNLKVLVSVESNTSAPISRAMIASTLDPRIDTLLGWEVQPFMDPNEVIDLVYRQKYWGAIYISEDNISEIINNGFETGSNVNTTGMLQCYFESGKDLNALTAYVIPTLLEFGDVLQSYLQTESYPEFIDPLNSTQFSNLRDTNLFQYPTITYTDGAPITNQADEGPLQVGLIYIVIITFFQVMWFMKLNADVGKTTASKDYIIFRMVISQITYLFLSLAFACLNAAFQIPLNNAWSGGFGVLWMIAFLTMSAVGGANENASLLAFPTLPPLMGFWLLFFVMLNISATFAPVQLCPGVYKFVYAMPIKNGYELIKVLIFNTYRGNIGREFGILVAWIVLNNLLMPFCIIFASARMKKKVVAEQKAMQEILNSKIKELHSV